MVDDISIGGYQPGGLSRLCALQCAYYGAKFGLGAKFESVVSADVAEFLARFDPDRDFVQLVQHKGEVRGGIVIDSQDCNLARLRWFFLHDELRGNGMGNRLVSNAMEFVMTKKYPNVFLTTVRSLDTARHLYEKAGFTLSEEAEDQTWNTGMVGQRFDWRYPDTV